MFEVVKRSLVRAWRGATAAIRSGLQSIQPSLRAVALSAAGAAAASDAVLAQQGPQAPPAVGVAGDPSRWEVAPGNEYLAKAEEVKRHASGQIAAVREAAKQVDEALAEARRNPGSEPHRRALLETTMRSIDTVQIAIQSVLSQGPALEGAYAQDVDRLRRLDKQRADGAAKAAADLKAVREDLGRLDARLEPLLEGGDDEALEELMFEQARLRDLADYHAAIVGTRALRERSNASALTTLRAGRRTMVQSFQRLDRFGKGLSVAMQTLEVVAEGFEAQKVADAITRLGDVAQALIGDGGIEDSAQQVVAMLAPAETSASPERRAAQTSFDEWKKQERERLAKARGAIGKAADDPPAGGRQ